MLGIGIGVSTTFSSDTGVSHLAESGVNVRGRTYPLQKYGNDRFIPSVVTNLWDPVRTFWNDLLGSFSSEVSEVQVQVDTTNPNVDPALHEVGDPVHRRDEGSSPVCRCGRFISLHANRDRAP